MSYPILHLKRSESHSYPIPDEVWNICNPLSEIYVQGSEQALQLLNQLPERGLAIVGTREPQLRSLTTLKKWIHELSDSHLIIISGLARGIDAAAHTAALEAGLPTIAILGTGLDIYYPAENTWLRHKILASDGLVVSEFPPGTPGKGFHFLQRNRIIASWAKATWIVEASQRSGSLNTARWARDQNRTCFAIPSFPQDPAFLGNQILLDRDHALPFWGIHNLGAVWLELATQTKNKNTFQTDLFGSPSKQTPDEALLVQFVTQLTHNQGGAQIQILLDWAISEGWNPQRFFNNLQSTISKKLIFDQSGMLISP